MYIHRLKERFRKIPIKQKLILLMMAVAVVSVVLTTLCSTISGLVYIKQNEEAELSLLAEVVGDKNAAAIAFQDHNLVKVNLEILAGKASVWEACIYDVEGKVVAQYVTETCPVVKPDGVVIRSGGVDVFHTIIKKGSRLGVVYIRSDLQAINHFIQKQWVVSAGIICIICLISYLITLQLQRVISSPIKILAEEVKAIFENDYSIRTNKIYEDELGDIADSFNKILEERERKHKEFFNKTEAVEHLSKASEKTLAILNDEAIFPFKSASTFKTLLENQVFGPVHPMYRDYFNDVYAAEVQLYYALAKAIDSLRLQSELLQIEKEQVDVGSLLDSTIADTYARCGDPRLSYRTCLNMDSVYTCYQKPLQRLIENIATLFIEAKTLGRVYQCEFELNQYSRDIELTAVMGEKDRIQTSGNDNFLSIKLETAILSIWRM
jgi:uncharacterized membrane protein affecting hemolysin expression